MDLIKELGALTLATRMKRLGDRFQNDVGIIFKERRVDAEARWAPLYYLLARDGAMSVVDIARALGVTHPAIHQMAQEMLKAGYLVQRKDANDGRRRLLELSDLALAIKPQMVELWTDVELAAQKVIRDTGYDVLGVLERIEFELDQRPFHQRIREQAKRKLQDEAIIVEFVPEHAEVFKALNLAWVEAEYSVEPEDIESLSNPIDYFLRPGGFIFLARVGKEYLGTAALRKVDENTFELCKMCVAEKARGLQIGKKLLDHALAKARMLGTAKVTLETSHKAKAAISLYRKAGFEHRPYPPDHPPAFARGDVWMELELLPVTA